MNQRPCSKQRGAALVEFAVVASALLSSLLLLTGLLGKQIDAKHDYEQALRYAAWERTVWRAAPTAAAPQAPVKSNLEIGNEIQARVFADRTGLVRSDHRTGNVVTPLDPMLMRPAAVRLDPANSAALPWLVDRSGGNGATRRYAGRLEGLNTNLPANVLGAGAVNTHLAILRLVNPTRPFDVRNDGLHRTQVQADLADTRHYKEFRIGNTANPIDLRVDRQRDGSTRNLTLLTDGWNVAGPGHAATRTRSLVLTSNLASGGPLGLISDALSVMGSIGGPLSSAGLLEFGRVDSEQVPAQRLGP